MMHSPNALQVHRTDLDNVTRLLALQDAVSSTPGHSGYIQQFCTVNHMVIFSAGNTDATRVDLKADTALVLPERRSDFRLHAWWSYLACGVRHAIGVLTSSHGRIGGQSCQSQFVCCQEVVTDIFLLGNDMGGCPIM